MMNAMNSTSTRPYLVRALYEWCTDNGYTPYVAVLVDHTVQVPREHVKDGEIVLNISFSATQALKLGNDFIEFKARFTGIARDIIVPMDRVIAIYARENGQGMAFPHPAQGGAQTPVAAPGRGQPGSPPMGQNESLSGPVQLSAVPIEAAATVDEPPRPPSGPRPTLTRIK
jgi:stringent starvation protein B